jgi:hypothetical protein
LEKKGRFSEEYVYSIMGSLVIAFVLETVPKKPINTLKSKEK